MANPIVGDVTLSAGDQDFVLRFGANAMAALEDKLDMSLGQIAKLFKADIRIGTLRTMLWASLLEHHDITEMDAGRIMDQVGMEVVGEKIGQAFTLAIPDRSKGKGAAKGEAGPRKAAKAAGTGKPS